MKGLGMLLAAAVIFAVAGVAMAETKAGSTEKPKANLEGTIVSASATAVVVKPHHGDDVTFTTTDKTKVTVDGKAATVADLKAGQKVKVTPGTGTATAIVAKTVKEKTETHEKTPKAAN